jgi:hypothetical protein
LKKVSLGKLLIGLGLFGACAPAVLAAENSGVFIGGDIAYIRSSVDFQTTFDGIFGLYRHTVTMKESSGSLGGSIRAGYIISPNHRAYFQFNNMPKTEHDIDGSSVHIKGEQSFKTFVVGYAFTPSMGEQSRFLLDIHAGRASAQASETITSGLIVMKEEMKFSGTVVGTKIGAIYDLTENGELEYGIKIDGYSYGDLTSNNGRISAKRKQSDVGLFLGVNYKF